VRDMYKRNSPGCRREKDGDLGCNTAPLAAGIFESPTHRRRYNADPIGTNATLRSDVNGYRTASASHRTLSHIDPDCLRSQQQWVARDE